MYFVLLLHQILSSFTHIVAKGLTNDIDPAVALFFRAAIVASLYAVWIVVNIRKIKRIEKKDIKTLLVLGALNIPINQFLFFQSIHLTTPPNVALAYALSPAFVLIIAVLFLKEKATKQKISGVVLAFAGVAVVFLEHGIDLSSEKTLGNILVLIASFAWGLYTIIGKNFVRKYGPVFSTAMAMITGFLLYIPIFLFLPSRIDLSSISTVNWLQLLYVGVITSGVAYALWYLALTKIEATKVAVFNNLQPVLTTIFTVIFFSYNPTVYFFLGGAMIISGVVMTQRG